jgi:uncharacterized protein
MRATLLRAAYVVVLVASGLSLGLFAGWATQAPPSDEPVALGWERLIPRSGWFGGTTSSPAPTGVVPHGQLGATSSLAQGDAELVRDYDGKRVRIPGYMVPIDFDGVAATEFLLVPYVGACIHVPPPPPNQIVHVLSKERVRVGRQFEPVLVTGTFAAAPLSTELAEVGYRIVAEAVVPYAEK